MIPRKKYLLFSQKRIFFKQSLSECLTRVVGVGVYEGMGWGRGGTTGQTGGAVNCGINTGLTVMVFV